LDIIKNSNDVISLSNNAYKSLVQRLSNEPVNKSLEITPLHIDGGLIYTSLSNEAKKQGTLNKYDYVKKIKGTINIDGYIIHYSMPNNVTAYDMLPISYTFTPPMGVIYPIHIAATAFEEESRRRGRNLYDLNLPGDVDVTYEYLGYVTGVTNPSARPSMKPDATDNPVDSYPDYKTTNLTLSGVLPSADLTWFKFKLTNTGNTILDPDGNGAYLIKPSLLKKNDLGDYMPYGQPENFWYRTNNYLYPGESEEIWFNFVPSPFAPSTNKSWGINDAGDYRILIETEARFEKGSGPNWSVTMYTGYNVGVSQWDFKVDNYIGELAPNEVMKISNLHNSNTNRNTWLHSFEEYMSSYNTLINESSAKTETMYIQVAPWSTQIVLKLITDSSIKTEVIPITVDTSSIKVAFNKNNQNYVIIGGKKQPVIMTQAMFDMRQNVQYSPYPQIDIVKTMKLMKECGVNVLAHTSMSYLFDRNFSDRQIEPNQNSAYNSNGDAYKYYLDIARQLGITIEGFISYPINRDDIGSIANWISGENYNVEKGAVARYSYTSPKLSIINAILGKYIFKRWGDNYYSDNYGNIPLSIEDTRGWFRIDYNIRYRVGLLSIQNFTEWVNLLYGSLKEINLRWESNYSCISDINPETDGSPRDSISNDDLMYLNKNKTFYDYSQGMIDWDIYRSQERAQNYIDIIHNIKNTVPNPVIALRTEGGNWLVSGIDPQSKNPAYRFIYYNQRRQGMIPEIIQATGAVRSQSDYITYPYTESMVRDLTRKSVEQGIIPQHMPLFNAMKDIVINTTYGDEESINYNAPIGTKGAHIVSITSLFGWFKATYEEGGTPGVLWLDYLCDGHVTETQIKEMKFFKQKLDEAFKTSKAKKWEIDLSKEPLTEWKNFSAKKYSYQPSFIKEMIETISL
jgi:hypothetical protein